jgi:hypothetical protein
MTFDGVYNSIVNGKEEPVTGEDGLRVILSKLQFKVVLRKKQSIYSD